MKATNGLMGFQMYNLRETMQNMLTGDIWLLLFF